MNAMLDSAALAERIGMPVVHLDERTLIVDKPAGISAQMRVDTEGVSVQERVRRAGFPKAELPHRLDRITSGLMVIALDRGSVRLHNEAIRDELWTKIYVARIERRRRSHKLLGPKKLYLVRKGRRAEVVNAGGRPARLEVLALADVPEHADRFDAVIRLDDGRFHQIRATCAHFNAPVAGDTAYGAAALDEPNAPLLRHVMLRLPLPLPGSGGAREWRLVRAASMPPGAQADPDLDTFLDAMASDLEPPEDAIQVVTTDDAGAQAPDGAREDERNETGSRHSDHVGDPVGRAPSDEKGDLPTDEGDATGSPEGDERRPTA